MAKDNYEGHHKRAREAHEQYRANRPTFGEIKQCIIDVLRPLETHRCERAEKAEDGGLMRTIAYMPESVLPAYGAEEGMIICLVWEKFAGTPKHIIVQALKDLEQSGQIYETEDESLGKPVTVWRIRLDGQAEAESEASPETSAKQRETAKRATHIANVDADGETGTVAPLAPARHSADDTSSPEIDKPTLALAILFQQPDISPTDLANRVGVARSTLYSKSPKWKPVRQTLTARGDGTLPKGRKGNDGSIEAEHEYSEYHPADDDDAT
ncbi:MAG: hypothetical protein JSU86_03185 [Phycisphaerales bacterium]|nr:MAG: hypothetical protein JSU86_03185 [Phycisphaerales bacterium]